MFSKPHTFANNHDSFRSVNSCEQWDFYFYQIRPPNATGFLVSDQFREPLCVGLSRTSQPPVGMTSQQVMSRVTEFANSGLRTLVIGAKLITSVEWSHLKSELDDARGLLEGRDQALSRIYGKIEQGFLLVGCTGVEDMLQDGVPETIQSLREAGIQVSFQLLTPYLSVIQRSPNLNAVGSSSVLRWNGEPGIK